MRAVLYTCAAMVLLPVALAVAQPTPVQAPAADPPAKQAQPKERQQEQSLLAGTDELQLPDTQILGGGKEFGFGRLIQLSVAPIPTDNPPKNLHSVAYTWRVRGVAPKTGSDQSKPLLSDVDDLYIVEDGRRILFGSGVQNAKFNVELFASYVFVIKNADGQSQILQRVVVVDKDIKVGGDANTGTVTPVTDYPDIPTTKSLPPPPPPLPDTPLGLARRAYNWVQAVELDPAAKRRDAAALSRSFRQLVELAGSNDEYVAPDGTRFKITDVESLTKATRTSNYKAIAGTLPQWRPWFDSLSQSLSALKQEGKMGTLSDRIAAWQELAIGLDAVGR